MNTGRTYVDPRKSPGFKQFHASLMRKPERIRRILDFACPQCRAQPSELCMTSNGNVSYLHGSRIQLAFPASGYTSVSRSIDVPSDAPRVDVDGNIVGWRDGVDRSGELPEDRFMVGITARQREILLSLLEAEALTEALTRLKSLARSEVSAIIEQLSIQIESVTKQEWTELRRVIQRAREKR